MAIKRMKFLLLVFVTIVLLPPAAIADRLLNLNLVVQMKGRGGFEIPPDDIAQLLPQGAGGCFVTDLADPDTSWIIGKGYDCLLGAPVFVGGEGGFTIETAYVMDIRNMGAIVTVNNVTVQPALDAPPEETGITHIVGDFPAGPTIYSGSRRFKNSEGSVRVSGGNDLRELDLTSPETSFITFDYLFVVSFHK
ncbi:MAG: hypothetical protein L0Z73_19340 [Gammaproteobacteria bacterium]|nr:hypothetical protein [Gammaproteobacteria bacterium]